MYSWETDEIMKKQVIDTNILGMIYGSQVAAAVMLRQKHGTIYSMEGMGSNGMIQKKTIHYGTTKCALTYYMKGLAKELEGTGVTAGRLSPGMMLTDFITKDPKGKPSGVVKNEDFRKIFNTLAEKPETVADFLVPKMMKNKKNDTYLVWLTNGKDVLRFMLAPFRKRRLI